MKIFACRYYLFKLQIYELKPKVCSIKMIFACRYLFKLQIYELKPKVCPNKKILVFQMTCKTS